MATFPFFGRSIDLAAKLAATRGSSRDESAWLHGQYTTVELLKPLQALRVHTNNRAFAGREASREAGAWVLIGDVVQTSSEIADSRSLPTSIPQSMTAFTHASEAYLSPNTVLNIGLASAKFGGMGGAFQAEYVSGPPIQFKLLVGKHWHGKSGTA